MTSKEWCADRLSKLLNEELRITTLNEIKDHLQSIPSNEVKPTVNCLDLPLVFDCLNDTNTEQIDLACDVLSLCLENLNIGESAVRYGVSLERALSHPYPAVKLMVLKELERNVKNDDVLVDLCKRITLLESIIRCMGCDDLAVASKSSHILTIVGSSDIGIKQLTSSNTIKVFNEVQSMDEIKRLRIFEAFINISKEARTSFQCLNVAGLISPIIVDLYNNDKLVTMNIIEILSELGQTEYGFEYLESKNVLFRLSEMLEIEDPLNQQLCIPGILKFFGKIGHWKPNEIFEKYPHILKKLFEYLNGSDLTLFGISVDTIGYIGITSPGKCSLDVNVNFIPIISHRLGSLPTELTIRALKCIENLLKNDGQNPHISLICRKWFFAISRNPMTDVILKYAKNPFSELRVAGLNVIGAIANQMWGQEIIKDTPGLIEFILDRNAETHKECKEIKYDIIKSLSSSSILDQQILRRLNMYISEGPFYVQGIMEVAFEGNN